MLDILFFCSDDTNQFQNISLLSVYKPPECSGNALLSIGVNTLNGAASLTGAFATITSPGIDTVLPTTLNYTGALVTVTGAGFGYDPGKI